MDGKKPLPRDKTPTAADLAHYAEKYRGRVVEVLGEIANGPDELAPRAQRLLKRYARRGEPKKVKRDGPSDSVE